MLDDIRIFVEVVKAGSFTGAAEVLSLSRSLISKKLGALERVLGVRLLNRTTRRLSLTEAGEHFYHHCQNGLLTIDEAVDQIHAMSAEPRGRLYVNLPVSFGVTHIAPYIPEFLEAYPNIDIDMHFDDRRVDVIAPGFDVSIRVAELEDSTLVARKLGVCRHLIVASPAYVERNGEPVSPQELVEGHRVAAYSLQDASLQWSFTDINGKSEVVKLKASIYADNSLALRKIVLGGAAIGRMPTFLVGPDVKVGKLVVLFPELAVAVKPIYAIYPQRSYLPSKTKVFLEFLAEKISDPPWWDEGLVETCFRPSNNS